MRQAAQDKGAPYFEHGCRPLVTEDMFCPAYMRRVPCLLRLGPLCPRILNHLGGVTSPSLIPRDLDVSQ